MGVFMDLKGEKFGLLTAIKRVGTNKFGCALWLCVCECGNQAVISSNSLSCGASQSCGCIRKQKITKHGMYRTRLYKIWDGMRQRCFNPNASNYAKYGKRGICVCSEWDDFSVFYNWSITHGYSNTLTLDRIDNNKGYYPNNCRWATLSVQQNNKSNNRLIECNGQKKTAREWSNISGVPFGTLRARLRKGWKSYDAIYKPVRLKARKEA